MKCVASFSKSKRNLILTADLVTALTGCLKSETAMPMKTRQCIERINKRISNIREIVYGGPNMVLSPGDFRKYERIICSIKKIIDNMADDVVELDFINAILALVEDARISSRKSKNKTLQREMGYLNQSLATLYGHVDPELSEHTWMVLGENLAGRFRKIMVG